MKKNIIRLLVPVMLLIALAISGCTRGFNINFGFPINGIEKSGEETAELDLQSSDKIRIENETGNIDVTKSSSGQIKVRIEKKVRGQVEEEIQKVLDEIKISAKYEGGTCVIKAVTSDGTDFWNWKQRNHAMLNVNVDFHVELPQDFSGYDVKLVTGNIDVKDLTGSFAINNITGNLTLGNLTMVGSNQVKLITGNITLSADILKADSLDVSNITGNVDVSLPGDSSADLSVKLTTGNIGGNLLGQTSTALGGSHVSKTLGDGKTSVNIGNVTGNITISKK